MADSVRSERLACPDRVGLLEAERQPVSHGLAPSEPLETLSERIVRRVSRLSSDAKTVLGTSIVAEVVRVYWKNVGGSPKFPLLASPVGTGSIPRGLNADVIAFGEATSRLSVADAAYRIGLLYAGTLSAEKRSTLGMYFTPPPLASRLLGQVERAGLDWATCRLLDPAVGSGVFLVLCAERVLRALPSDAPAAHMDALCNLIAGTDIDPFAAWLAEVFFQSFCLPLSHAAGRGPRRVVRVIDSLAIQDTVPIYTLVVGNPPFGKTSLDEATRKRFARSLYGHANRYGLFFDLAIRLTSDRGFISFLTPSSFLGGEYFKNLRQLIWNEAPPVALDFVTSRKGVFDGVLQETVLATLRKGGSRGTARVHLVTPGTPDQPTPVGRFALPGTASSPWIIPRDISETRFVDNLLKLTCRLNDWGYSVSTGPLVWNRMKHRLTEAEDRSTVPIIWAECIASDGRFVYRWQKRNHKPFLRVGDDEGWLVIRAPCVLLQRTTAREQTRRLIAAALPPSFIAAHGGVTVENHVNMLIPTSNKPAVPPRLLALFLNSPVADRAFRCLSGSVAVSAYELENLPLPSGELLRELAGTRYDKTRIYTICERLYS